jgi:fatty acid desaturase
MMTEQDDVFDRYFVNLIRKLVAVLALAALLWTAFFPLSTSLVWAVVVPFLLFFGLVSAPTFEPRREEVAIPAQRQFSPIALRAPPRH